jgi:hypothetical protein
VVQFVVAVIGVYPRLNLKMDGGSNSRIEVSLISAADGRRFTPIRMTGWQT